MTFTTNMNLSTEKPPIYEEARKHFDLSKNQGTYFTYGDTIYNPDNLPLSQELIAHEETHGHQQEMDATVAKIWWARYFQDSQFRIEQETEAYGMQYRFYCKRTKDREKRARYLRELATMLSSPMYGSVVTHPEAVQMIRSHAKI